MNLHLNFETRRSEGVNMRFNLRILCVFAVLLLPACAGRPVSQPKPTAFLSPIMYETFDCQQIADEAKTLSAKYNVFSHDKSQKTENANLIIWPASVKQIENKEQDREFQSVKTKFEALKKASEREKCNLELRVENIADNDNSAKIKEEIKKFL